MSAPSAASDRLEPVVETACTVCGGSGHDVVASKDELEAQRRYLRLFHRRRLRSSGGESLEERADFTQGYSTNIVACRTCGLVFRDPRPTDEAIASAYAGDTYGSERLDALFDSQLELFRPKARRLRRWIAGANPVVLEIGSFVGGFLAASGEAGLDAIGIDPGNEVASFCEAHGLRVLHENAEDCSFPPGTADCVAIWNTFDQLPDPHPTLESARRCLKPGALLVVRVPNGRCFAACVARLRRWPAPLRRVLLASMAWNNLLSFPYLHGYALGTLDRLMSQYGFVRVHQQGDVLTRLADEQTRAWAIREERALKMGWRVLFGAASMVSRDGSDLAPWIDVYFEARSGDG